MSDLQTVYVVVATHKDGTNTFSDPYTEASAAEERRDRAVEGNFEYEAVKIVTRTLR